MLRKKILSAILVCFVLVVSACSQGKETTTESKGDSGEKTTKLTFSEPARILSVAPLYVAINKDTSKKKGLKRRLLLAAAGHKSLQRFCLVKHSLPFLVLEACSLRLIKAKIW